MRAHRIFGIGFLGAALTLVCGCSAYVAPGRGADMSQVGLTPEAQKKGTDFDMRAAFERKPLARFPAAVAVARIQAPGYESRTAQTWGHGNYCIVTNRDVEKPQHFEKLSKLPMLHGIAPISRSLLTTSHFTSHEPLRQAAA